MWSDLWAALALVLVVEGLMPAISPRGYRNTMIQVTRMDDRSLRGVGLASMILGALLLYLIRH